MNPKPASIERQKRKRCWVERHGCRELLAELAAQRLSLTAAVKLAHLPLREQRRRLARKAQRINDQEAAAIAIKEFLAQHVKDGTIDLGELCGVIVEGLRGP
jgi:hypothetical protein